jgi:hypothetical protein
MPTPFERIFKKPGFRRILLPFSVALAVVLLALLVLSG